MSNNSQDFKNQLSQSDIYKDEDAKSSAVEI